MHEDSTKISLNIIFEINFNDFSYFIHKYENKNQYEAIYNRATKGEKNKGVHFFGANEWQYIKLDSRGKITYWKILFANLSNNYYFMENDRFTEEKYIEIRDNFERKVFGDIQFILPRLESESIDIRYLDILEQKIRKMKYEWLINTACYWNQKNKKSRDVFRLQSISRRKCYGGILDKYDCVYSSLEWASIKGGRLIGFSIEEIADLSNFVPLLLNTIKNLLAKNKESL